MTPLPQELVDKIIDEVACSHPRDSDSCSPYSLISKVWVERTQKYHFSYVDIYGNGCVGEVAQLHHTGSVWGITTHSRLVFGQDRYDKGLRSTSTCFQWHQIPSDFFLRLLPVAFGGGVFHTDGFEPSPVKLPLANHGTNHCHPTCHAPLVGDLRHRHDGKG